VPNYLPYPEDADGAGSLGMLGLIDPVFDNTFSTTLIRLDNFATTADDPTPADTLVYTHYPPQFDHASIAMGWTESMASNFSSWLFAHSSAEPSPAVTMMRTSWPPRLEIAWDPVAGEWQLVWPDARWVLQETTGLDTDWQDVAPTPSSPYSMGLEGGYRYFRLRESGQD